VRRDREEQEREHLAEALVRPDFLHRLAEGLLGLGFLGLRQIFSGSVELGELVFLLEEEEDDETREDQQCDQVPNDVDVATGIAEDRELFGGGLVLEGLAHEVDQEGQHRADVHGQVPHVEACTARLGVAVALHASRENREHEAVADHGDNVEQHHERTRLIRGAERNGDEADAEHADRDDGRSQQGRLAEAQDVHDRTEDDLDDGRAEHEDTEQESGAFVAEANGNAQVQGAHRHEGEVEGAVDEVQPLDRPELARQLEELTEVLEVVPNRVQHRTPPALGLSLNEHFATHIANHISLPLLFFFVKLSFTLFLCKISHMAEKQKQLFLWFGANDYEIFEQVKLWSEVFSKKYSGLNIAKFDYKEKGNKDELIKDIKNALQVNSLFGNNKLVILKNFLDIKINKDLQELLLSSIDKLSDGFFAIFIEDDKPDARGKLFKAIKDLEKKKIAEVKEYLLPRNQDLIIWVKKAVEKENALFNPKALELLIAMVGNDLWQLDCEIKKLSNYNHVNLDNHEIMVVDVDLLVKGKFNDDIFQLMDAIGTKNRAKALKLFQDQIDSGANDVYLLTMLERQFRINLQIKEALSQGNLSANELASELHMHPFVVQKTMQQCGKFSLPELKDIYNKLLDFEIKLKTAKINFELMFDLMIVGLK